MTDELLKQQKTIELQEYTNLCAEYGDLQVRMEQIREQMYDLENTMTKLSEESELKLSFLKVKRNSL